MNGHLAPHRKILFLAHETFNDLPQTRPHKKKKNIQTYLTIECVYMSACDLCVYLCVYVYMHIYICIK